MHFVADNWWEFGLVLWMLASVVLVGGLCRWFHLMRLKDRQCKVQLIRDYRPDAVQSPRFLKNRRAVTTLEYGIMASVLGLVLVVVFHGFGHTVSTLFSRVATSI